MTQFSNKLMENILNVITHAKEHNMEYEIIWSALQFAVEIAKSNPAKKCEEIATQALYDAIYEWKI